MDFPVRKNTRIPGYDYSTPNYYFVTICTHEKRCLFGAPGCLNLYGEYARNNLLQISQLKPAIQIDAYVVMPNHIHAILVISQESQDANIPSVIGQYKMSVTKRIRSHEPHKKVWQRSFHDHIIRNQSSYEKIREYIQNNPLKWEEDCFYRNNSIR